MTATGIRGALGTIVLEAKAANASAPRGVVDKGRPVFVVTEVVVLVSVVFGLLLATKAGGVALLGVITVAVELLVIGAALAHRPPELDCNLDNLASIDGLISAGIKIRIGLLVSI